MNKHGVSPGAERSDSEVLLPPRRVQTTASASVHLQWSRAALKATAAARSN